MLLNCHSHFSYRYGTIPIEELLSMAKQNGYTSIALTDINNTSACVEFVRLAPQYGIKPVVGVDFRNGVHQQFIAIARNNAGFREINEFLSRYLHSEEAIPRYPSLRAQRKRSEAIPSINALSHGIAFPHMRRNDVCFGDNVFVIYPLHNAPSPLRDNEFIGVKPKELMKLKFSSPLLGRGVRGEAQLVILSPVSFRRSAGADSPLPGRGAGGEASSPPLWGGVRGGAVDFNCHRLLRAIDNNTLLSKLPESEVGSRDEVMLHRDELLHGFAEFPQIIHNTELLFDQCSIDFAFGVNKNKQSFTASVQDDYKLLRQLCGDNLLYRYPEPSAEVLSRIEKELTTICDLGFSSYFLINWDLVNYARHKGYYYVGRGSGANSIVAYLLRITDVDPVELDLYFERFINPYRTSPPDFDIDFSWMDRDDVTRYLFDRHGRDRTALVGAYSTFQFKAVTRELGKVFGLPAREIDRLQKGEMSDDVPSLRARLPDGQGSPDAIGTTEAIPNISASTQEIASLRYRSARNDGNSKNSPPLWGGVSRIQSGRGGAAELVLRYAHYLHGMPSHITVHSSGILIAHEPISSYTATILPPKGYPTTHFSMLEAEDIGLYKFDILGQRGLGKIKDTLEIIKRNRHNHRHAELVSASLSGSASETLKQVQPARPSGGGDGAQEESDFELPDIHNVTPFKKDEKVKAMLRNGQAIGCFYVESPAMRMLLKKLQADTYLGLVAASSIIRPGVARSGMMREYIMRFRNEERRKKAREELPELYDILHETFGVMVYQEDVLKVAHYFAGLTLAEADVLRRGMSWKFKQRNEFDSVKEKFFSNCKAKGFGEKVIAEVWRQIESFANYAFAKGHSASYAVESYQALWLKAYYPLEYMVATVNNGGGYYSAELYLHEARLHGGVVMAPDINRSDALTTIVGKTIFLGFGLMKDLEVETIRALLDERARGGPFHDLTDFVSRVSISLEQISILIRIGAFRFTGKTKKALLWEAHFLLGPSGKTHPTPRLFDNPPKTFTLPQLYHYDLQDAFDELEILGFALCSPFELLRDDHLGAWAASTPPSVIRVERHSEVFDTPRSQLLGPEDSPPLWGGVAEGRGGANSPPLGGGVGGGADLLASDLPHHLRKRIQITAYLVNIKYTTTHDGKRMYFGTFLDLDGQWLDTVHFPPVAKQYPFSGPGCYRITGKVTEEFGCYSIEVSKIDKLALRSEEDEHPKLRVPNNYGDRYHFKAQ